jgi:Tfp pilus assembly protein PilN
MRAVNLLPADRHDAKKGSGAGPNQRSVIVACTIASVALVGALVFMVWQSNSSVSNKQKQLAALQARVAAGSSELGLAATATDRRATVAGLAGDRLAWDEFLQTVSKVMPEDVWVTSLEGTTAGAAATLAAAQAAAQAAATPLATTTAATTTTTSTPLPAATSADAFTLSGITYSQPSVARVMRRLGFVPWLSDVTLVSSAQTTVGTATLYAFTLKANLASPPVAS